MLIPSGLGILNKRQVDGLDPEKLYVTVYLRIRMRTASGTKKLVLAEDRIIEVEDNFWDIGEGPCGPDSEIFYDRGQSFNNVK